MVNIFYCFYINISSIYINIFKRLHICMLQIFFANNIVNPINFKIHFYHRNIHYKIFLTMIQYFDIYL